MQESGKVRAEFFIIKQYDGRSFSTERGGGKVSAVLLMNAEKRRRDPKIVEKIRRKSSSLALSGAEGAGCRSRLTLKFPSLWLCVGRRWKFLT